MSLRGEICSNTRNQTVLLDKQGKVLNGTTHFGMSRVPRRLFFFTADRCSDEHVRGTARHAKLCFSLRREAAGVGILQSTGPDKKFRMTEKLQWKRRHRFNEGKKRVMKWVIILFAFLSTLSNHSPESAGKSHKCPNSRVSSGICDRLIMPAPDHRELCQHK